MKLLTNIPTFLKEVKIELKKVNWPTKGETIKNTLLIIGVCAAVAMFLGALDLFFTELLNTFIL
jgi:preprotein translocase subunit SecE